MSKGGLIKRARRNIFYKTLSESTRVLPALLFVYIARRLGDEDFGKLSFAYSFAGICIIIADFGLNTILIRNLSRQKGLTKEYVDNIFVLKIVLSLISISAMGLFLVFTDYSVEMVAITMVFGGVMFFKTLMDFFCAVFNAYERMDIEAFLKGTNQILLFFAGTIVLVLGFGLLSLAKVFFIVYLISAIIGFYIVYVKIARIRPALNLEFWRGILRESLPLALTIMFTVVYFKIDVVMLSLIRGDDGEIGLYSAAMRLIELIGVIPALIVSALFPIISNLYQESKDSFDKVFRTSFKYLLVVALPITVGTLLLSDRIIYTVYSEEYFKSIPALKILAFAIFFIFVNYILMNVLVSVDRQKINAIVAGACVIVNILLNLCLIPYYGYLGAGIATVITEVILFALSLYYVTKHVCRVDIVLFIRPFVGVIIMGMFIAVIITKLHLALIIFLSALIYFSCLLILRFFTKDDKVFFLHLLGRLK